MAWEGTLDDHVSLVVSIQHGAWPQPELDLCQDEPPQSKVQRTTGQKILS